MKKFLQFFTGALFAAVAFAIFNLAFSDPAVAAVNRNENLPVTWSARGGTNAFSINASAVPVLTYRGTNWTGVTTNVALTNTTFRLNIINGIVVGTSAL